MRGDNFPRCPAMGCVHNAYNPDVRGTQCTILTECLMDYQTGDCPFYAKHSEAAESRKAAHKRAVRMGCLAVDDTYRPRFTKVRLTLMKDGSEKAELVPDIPAWLDHLAQEGIITQAFADQRKARYSE